MKLYYNLNYNSLGNNNFFSVFTGHLVDTFSLYLLKHCTFLFGINHLNLNLNLNVDLRKYYFFNNSMKSLELNNIFFFLGTNPKVDSPILNLKIRNLKFKYNKQINVCYIGSKVLLNYSFMHLGLHMNTMIKLFLGKSFFCKTIDNFYNIIFFFSVAMKQNNNFSFLMDLASFFLKKKNFIFNYLTLFSSDVSLHELGIVSYYYTKSNYILNNDIKMCYLLGLDYNNMVLNDHILKIYHGHHGNIGLKFSDIVLPSTTFIENNNFYINCEGRFFVSNLAITKKKKMSYNESILYNLFNFFFTGKKENVQLINIFIFFFYKLPFFFTKYKYSNKLYLTLATSLKKLYFSNNFITILHNYYSTDVISQSSYYLSKLKFKKNNF